MKIHDVCRRPGESVENWSLYWKESMLTDTKASVSLAHIDTCASCLPPIELDLPDSGFHSPDAATAPKTRPTVADLLAESTAALGWQPAASLNRLEGFTAPWERVLAAGRELQPELPLGVAAVEAAAAAAGDAGALPTFVVVRVALKADGWKIQQPGDFLTDSESDSDAE
ncbi:hypothetical protein VOLCADRAFT_95260 [Volvox carteri f. nagariensis]|uniref:Uncharacterized protein n=1 Tax=Volvox carteri f. nagariensis TaxID=3068 RepID=D8U713_VOLCA|nr:uncharacterized protein VOLCADRAFT_95260 [Volvox carteri f. nagariensis]EFJ44605.1 hypothetical protein VOLCADRAFT_95260 [Volvox carteri f. nagariensis]|eukprot:XP_002954455.1 hypothetical protein VOLCADRAFT_95260 [Volvox carteri f. nagariensis]